MKLHKCIFTKNDCYKKNVTIIPKGIVVHDTGSVNSNLRRYVQPDDGILGKNLNNNDWNRPKPEGRKVCVHAFIGLDAKGTVRTYQTLPFTIQCWGCGQGSRGSYNNGYIQFECCRGAASDKTYYQAVMQEAKEFCAYLCKLYNIPVENIVSHHEAHLKGYASNHSDCDSYMALYGDNMNGFRNDVKALISKNTKPQGDNEMVEQSKIIVGNKEVPVSRILKDGNNYIKIRDVADALGYNIAAKGNIPVLTKK